MLLRDQRARRASMTEAVHRHRDAIVWTTEIYPWYVATEPHAATAVGLRMPGVTQFYRDDGPLGGRVNIVDNHGGSWARVRLTDTDPYPVEQAGPRRLWDEAVAAYRWWQRAGEPERDRWVVTVGPDGHHVVLDPTGSERSAAAAGGADSA